MDAVFPINTVTVGFIPLSYTRKWVHKRETAHHDRSGMCLSFFHMS